MSRKNDGITRRSFMRAAGASGLASMALFYGGCRPGSGGQRKQTAGGKKVVVLGVDGLDPRLCERLMDRGDLPNLSRMRQAGGYCPLGTSIPPQTPVAWANFITGADAGVHGIFDFIHRDPARQFWPQYSAAQTIDAEQGWEVGEHKIPLTFWPFNHGPAQTLLRREGVPFWDYLDEIGVPLWIYDIPVHYPPSASRRGNLHCLSGMGVPDLLGTYGTYQYFSNRIRRTRTEGGGVRNPLRFKNHSATASLEGPLNTLLKKPVSTKVDIRIYRHPHKPLARIELQDHTIVLKEGEWSDWQQIRFPLEMPSFLPNEHVSGICRFYLQQVRPDFRLYATPINIDPSDPGKQRISEPPEFVSEISEKLGLFYTTGFQEDHKALSNGVFDDAEYLKQAEYVLQERMNLLHFALDHYTSGLLFFYFSSTDLQAHMFWWDCDEKHPVRSAAEARKYHRVVEDLYRKMDKVIGDVQKRCGDDATLLVISDHGFTHFSRQFNLNTWLRDNGYIQPADCTSLLSFSRGTPVDWSRSSAYGLGLNGIYLNLEGRERDGIVEPAQRDALLEELREKLLALRDPDTGQPVIASVHRADEVYTGPFVSSAPDLIVGCRRGYRLSWAATLGGITDEVIHDNDSAWSADHCIAAEEVPGVVFSNKPIRRESPSLVDLAPTILAEFGVAPSVAMTGGELFKPRPAGLAAAMHKE